MRLNGWQRIGIIASIVWIIGGGLWGNNVGIHEGDWAVDAYRFCISQPHYDSVACSQTFYSQFPEATKHHWEAAALFAFVPIPVAWLLVWGLVALARWVRAGFTASRSG